MSWLVIFLLNMKKQKMRSTNLYICYFEPSYNIIIKNWYVSPFNGIICYLQWNFLWPVNITFCLKRISNERDYDQKSFKIISFKKKSDIFSLLYLQSSALFASIYWKYSANGACSPFTLIFRKYSSVGICDVLCDLVPFEQHSWRSVTFRKPATLLK